MTGSKQFVNLESMTSVSLDFFGRLKWIDGRPLMETIERLVLHLGVDLATLSGVRGCRGENAVSGHSSPGEGDAR